MYLFYIFLHGHIIFPSACPADGKGLRRGPDRPGPTDIVVRQFNHIAQKFEVSYKNKIKCPRWSRAPSPPSPSPLNSELLDGIGIGIGLGFVLH